jgi:hypothetical protein
MVGWSLKINFQNLKVLPSQIVAIDEKITWKKFQQDWIILTGATQTPKFTFFK